MREEMWRWDFRIEMETRVGEVRRRVGGVCVAKWLWERVERRGEFDWDNVKRVEVMRSVASEVLVDGWATPAEDTLPNITWAVKAPDSLS